MTYNIIGSGSTGNATIVFDHILIDCGLPFTKIAPYAKEIQLVLLTHKHGDHFNPSTVRMLHKWRPTVRWACCEWMVPLLVEAGVDAPHIDVVEPDKQGYDYGLFAVEPFTVPHNVPNCGWKIYHTIIAPGGLKVEKLFYATDASTLDGITAKDFDMYMIECNHHEDEIRERIAAKEAAGEYSYEVEASRNHLSWEQAMSWLAENGPHSTFIPMHQHIDKG